MLRLFFRVKVFLILLSYAFGSQANEKSIIAGGQIISLFEYAASAENVSPDTHGAYYFLLDEILKRTGLNEQYQLVVYSINKGKQGFLNKEFACFSPGSDSWANPKMALKNIPHYSSSPMNIAIARVITLPHQPIVSSPGDISNEHIISITTEVNYTTPINEIFARAKGYFEVRTELENLKVLASGRASHSVVFYPDVLSAYKQLNMSTHYPFDENFAPIVIKDNIICHPEHVDAFYLIEQHLRSMRASGELEQLLGKHYQLDVKYKHTSENNESGFTHY